MASRDLVLEVTWHHLCHCLMVKAVTGHTAEQRTQSHPLNGERIRGFAVTFTSAILRVVPSPFPEAHSEPRGAPLALSEDCTVTSSGSVHVGAVRG